MNSVARLISRRRQAYARVFDPNGPLADDVKVVLDDLAKFGRFYGGLFHPNQRVNDVLLGRLEVVHRVLDFANLDGEALYLKYHGDKPHQTQEIA